MSAIPEGRRDHLPMEVELVPPATDGPLGPAPSPALNSKWSPVDRLRWKAGVVKAETGVTLTIIEWDAVNGYALSWGNGGVSAMRFYDAWLWMGAFIVGHQAAKGGWQE